MGDPRYFTNSRVVKELSPANFSPGDRTKLGGDLAEGMVVVMYYADWCPHCKSMRDAWESTAKKCTFASYAAFDCALFPKQAEKLEFVESYPTIVFYKEGEFSSQYLQHETDEKSLIRASMAARRT